MQGSRLMMAALVCLAVQSLACSSDGKDVIVINDNGGADYNPPMLAADFVRSIDNPYFTLKPGTTWVYEGKSDENKDKRVEVEVTADTRMILGIPAVVVRDRVWEDRELVEDTLDWFAQDKQGNVWYLGEDSQQIEGGKVSSTEGSWEAGSKGAKAGVIMKSAPRVGETYRQEYLKGEAEGVAEVVSITTPVKIGMGSFNDCIQIKEWTPLEKQDIEDKFYCRELGNLLLVRVSPGNHPPLELVQVKNP